MTYRIHHAVQPKRDVFILSGVLDASHASQLQGLLSKVAAARHTVLDLKDVTLVERDVVQFLARIEASGTELVNCPEYVRTWIAAENESLGSTRGEEP